MTSTVAKAEVVFPPSISAPQQEEQDVDVSNGQSVTISMSVSPDSVQDQEITKKWTWPKATLKNALILVLLLACIGTTAALCHVLTIKPSGQPESGDVPFARWLEKGGLSLPAKPNDKLIWTFWDSGWDSMSNFGKVCIEVMYNLNPNAKLMFVTMDNLEEVLKLDGDDLPTDFKKVRWYKSQWRSDYLRGVLLAKYGGVYVDATTLFFDSTNILFTQLDNLGRESNQRVQSYGDGRGNSFWVARAKAHHAC